MRIACAVLGGIHKKPRTLADQICIQCFSADDFPCEQIPPVLMPLDDPSTRARAQGTHERTKDRSKSCDGSGTRGQHWHSVHFLLSIIRTNVAGRYTIEAKSNCRAVAFDLQKAKRAANTEKNEPSTRIPIQ